MLGVRQGAGRGAVDRAPARRCRTGECSLIRLVRSDATGSGRRAHLRTVSQGLPLTLARRRSYSEAIEAVATLWCCRPAGWRRSGSSGVGPGTSTTSVVGDQVSEMQVCPDLLILRFVPSGYGGAETGGGGCGARSDWWLRVAGAVLPGDGSNGMAAPPPDGLDRRDRSLRDDDDRVSIAATHAWPLLGPASRPSCTPLLERPQQAIAAAATSMRRSPAGWLSATATSCLACGTSDHRGLGAVGTAAGTQRPWHCPGAEAWVRRRARSWVRRAVPRAGT